MTRPVIYFLCTGNSCRSQMAEGWARHIGQGRVQAYSAGIETHGLNPRAIAVMKEAGVDISHHQSKLIDPELLSRADVVITLCGEAEETCPWTPPTVRRLHWPLLDPARVQGSQAEIMDAFRRVRDQIRDQVTEFLESLGE